MSVESHHLVALARNESIEARARLLSMLCTELLTGREVAGPELDLFYEISRLLLEVVGVDGRRTFSETVADRSTCPRDILMRLAGDEILVAEPVLVRADRLEEADLIDLAVHLSGDHRAAIARRRIVTPRTARALMRRGEREVLLHLGANPGAQIDEEALRLLRRRAEGDESLRAVLAGRRDLVTVRTLADEPKRPVAVAVESRDEIAVRLKRVSDGETTVDAVVVELADADRQADLAAFLARSAAIGESDAVRVLIRRDVDGIVTLAGGLGVEAASFARIVELRRRKLGLSDAQARWERQAFRDLDREQARATLQQVGRHRRAV